MAASQIVTARIGTPQSVHLSDDLKDAMAQAGEAFAEADRQLRVVEQPGAAAARAVAPADDRPPPPA